jgi:uncharacterized membrane protein
MKQKRLIKLSFRHTLFIALFVTIYGIVASLYSHSLTNIIIASINLILFIILYFTILKR